MELVCYAGRPARGHAIHHEHAYGATYVCMHCHERMVPGLTLLTVAVLFLSDLRVWCVTAIFEICQASGIQQAEIGLSINLVN